MNTAARRTRTGRCARSTCGLCCTFAIATLTTSITSCCCFLHRYVHNRLNTLVFRDAFVCCYVVVVFFFVCFFCIIFYCCLSLYVCSRVFFSRMIFLLMMCLSLTGNWRNCADAWRSRASLSARTRLCAGECTLCVYLFTWMFACLCVFVWMFACLCVFVWRYRPARLCAGECTLVCISLYLYGYKQMPKCVFVCIV